MARANRPLDERVQFGLGGQVDLHDTVPSAVDDAVSTQSELELHAVDLLVGAHGKPYFDIVAGGDGESTVAGIAETDTLLAVIVFDIELDTGAGASGNKVEDVSAAVDPAIKVGGGAVTYTGDLTGDKLLVIWLDRTA